MNREPEPQKDKEPTGRIPSETPAQQIIEADFTLGSVDGESLGRMELAGARLNHALIRGGELKLESLDRSRRATLFMDDVLLQGGAVEGCRARDSALEQAKPRRLEPGSAPVRLGLLVSAVLICSLFNLWWICAAGHPVDFYSHDNYGIGLNFALALGGNELASAPNALYHLPTYAWVNWFGPRQWAMNLTPLLYLLFFCCGLYLLAREFFDGATSWLAGLLGALMPGVVGFSRVYDDHTLNLCLQVWIVLLLVRSARLTRPALMLPALALAIAGGLGLQERTHWMLFLLGLAGPVIWLLLGGLRSNIAALRRGKTTPSHRRALVAHLITVCAIAAACCGFALWKAVGTITNPYYLQEATDVSGEHYISLAEHPAAALGFYPYSMLTNLAGPVVGLAGVAGLVLLFVRRHRARWLLLLWLAVPVVLLSFVGKKEQPYLVSAAAAMALAAASIPGLLAGAQRRTAIAMLAILSAGWIGLTSLSSAQYDSLNRVGLRLFRTGIIRFVIPPEPDEKLELLEADCKRIAELTQRLYPDKALVYVMTDDIRLHRPAQYFVQRELLGGAAYNLGSSERERLPRGNELLALISTSGEHPEARGVEDFAGLLQAAPFEPLPDQAWTDVLTGMDLQQVERGERYVLLGPLPRMIP